MLPSGGTGQREEAYLLPTPLDQPGIAAASSGRDVLLRIESKEAGAKSGEGRIFILFKDLKTVTASVPVVQSASLGIGDGGGGKRGTWEQGFGPESWLHSREAPCLACVARAVQFGMPGGMTRH